MSLFQFSVTSVIVGFLRILCHLPVGLRICVAFGDPANICRINNWLDGCVVGWLGMRWDE